MSAKFVRLIGRQKEAYLPDISCKQYAKYEENIMAYQSTNPLRIPATHGSSRPRSVFTNGRIPPSRTFGSLASNSPTARCN